MRSIYLLLTRSNSLPSFLIRFVTRPQYTHVSLSLDRELTQMYTFARKYERFPFPGGFKQEWPDRGFYRKHPNIPYALYEFSVSDEAYEGIARDLAEIGTDRKQYHYSYFGCVMCAMGIPYERRNYYFCSQFVAALLARNRAAALPVAASLMQPDRFLELPGIRQIESGRISTLKKF